MKPVGDRCIPIDPGLPALAELFPGSTTRGLISPALVQMVPGADLEDLEVSYVRYRPAKSCVVLWTQGGQEATHIVASGRVSHNDRGQRLLSRPANQPLLQVATRERPAYHYFAEDRLLVQRFPLDLRLPELVLHQVPSFLAQQHTTNGQTPLVTTVPISYKPWRRCVCRYDVVGTEVTSSYYGKLFRDDQGASLLELHRSVQETLIQRTAPWRLPTVYAHVGEAQTLLFHAIDEAVEVRRMLRPARKHPEARQRLLSHMGSAASGLAALQQTQLEGLRSETPSELVASFRRSSSAISEVTPEFGHSVGEALSRLEQAAATLPSEPRVTAHGAFRHDQLMESEGSLIVLDFDTICVSGASADAGNFLGYLDLTAIRRARLSDVIQDCANAFIQAIQREGFANEQWIAWYRAAAHVKKALRAFFSLEPAWPETAGRLFDLAGQTLREIKQ